MAASVLLVASLSVYSSVQSLSPYPPCLSLYSAPVYTASGPVSPLPPLTMGGLITMAPWSTERPLPTSKHGLKGPPPTTHLPTHLTYTYLPPSLVPCPHFLFWFAVFLSLPTLAPPNRLCLASLLSTSLPVALFHFCICPSFPPLFFGFDVSLLLSSHSPFNSFNKIIQV